MVFAFAGCNNGDPIRHPKEGITDPPAPKKTSPPAPIQPAPKAPIVIPIMPDTSTKGIGLVYVNHAYQIKIFTVK